MDEFFLMGLCCSFGNVVVFFVFFLLLLACFFGCFLCCFFFILIAQIFYWLSQKICFGCISLHQSSFLSSSKETAKQKNDLANHSLSFILIAVYVWTIILDFSIKKMFDLPSYFFHKNVSLNPIIGVKMGKCEL